MKFIEENLIGEAIDLFEINEKSFFEVSDHLIEQQLAISAALTEENLSILTDEEYDLLWFMAIVIYKSIQLKYESLNPISPKVFEGVEEENWNKWNSAKSKDFKGKLDVFFKDYPQEDLLAFVEDSLTSDEDVTISDESREVIFITCISIIDAFNISIKS